MSELCCVFFFKQKTAYEMRISDWSSDVCSSDLAQEKAMLAARPEMGKYYRNSAIYPNECMFFINADFKALMWESRGVLPNYRDWLFQQADLTSTYEYHKRFLQLLQADAPGI